jgi:hypothetical protein
MVVYTLRRTRRGTSTELERKEDRRSSIRSGESRVACVKRGWGALPREAPPGPTITSGSPPMVVYTLRRTRRGTSTKGENGKGRLPDMPHRTRRIASTVPGAAPGTTICYAEADHTGARSLPDVQPSSGNAWLNP